MSVKNIIFPLVAALALAAVQGCAPDVTELERSFTESRQPGFTVKGSVIHSFDPFTWQSSFCGEPCVFTMCTDDMSDYYTLRCSRMPVQEGDDVKCDVEWTTYSDIKSQKALSFEVVKTDRASGALWLWCSSARIGAVVSTCIP